MQDMNQLNIIGRLTRAPEIKSIELKDGSHKSVVNFSIASNHGTDDVSFFNVAVWGGLADVCQKYLDKGKQVGITGYLKQRRWEKDGEKRSTVEVVGTSVQFLTRKSDGNESNE